MQARQNALGTWGNIEKLRGDRFNALAGAPRPAESVVSAAMAGGALIAGA